MQDKFNQESLALYDFAGWIKNLVNNLITNWRTQR